MNFTEVWFIMLPAFLFSFIVILDVKHYVAVRSQDAVQFPTLARVTLDCLPYANETYGMEANLSTIKWFRIETKSSDEVDKVTEITTNGSRFILSGNKERLTIEAVTLATGAEIGTEAAYRCRRSALIH